MFICDNNNCGLIVDRVWGFKENSKHKNNWYCDYCKNDNSNLVLLNDSNKPFKLKKSNLIPTLQKRFIIRNESIVNDFLNGYNVDILSFKYELNKKNIVRILIISLGVEKYCDINKLNKLSTGVIDLNHK